MPHGIQFFRDDKSGGLDISEEMYQWINDYRTTQTTGICGDVVTRDCGNSYGLAFYLRNKTLEFFARAIYSEGWFPISKYCDEDFFAANFETLVDIYSHAGSYYALEKMITLLLGDDATFTYDNSTAGEITVTLTAETAEMTLLVNNNDTSEDNYLLVGDSGTKNLVVTASTADFTSYQVYLILQGLQVNGVRLNITF